MFPSAFTLYTVLVASIALAASMPTYPNKEIGPSYSGPGGQAPGGSVNSNAGGLVALFSGNAGNGGFSPSGASHSGDDTAQRAPGEDTAQRAPGDDTAQRTPGLFSPLGGFP